MRFRLPPPPPASAAAKVKVRLFFFRYVDTTLCEQLSLAATAFCDIPLASCSSTQSFCAMLGDARLKPVLRAEEGFGVACGGGGGPTGGGGSPDGGGGGGGGMAAQ